VYAAFRQFCERLLRIPPDPEAPPGDESTARVFRAAPNFYRYLLVIWGVKTLAALAFLAWLVIMPVVGSLALHKEGRQLGWWLLVIPGVAVPVVVVSRLFMLAALRLDFEKRWYVVTDRSLRVRAGVLSIREMTVTFANIQNISISQGPIQRLLGIADLRVDTAGGGAVNEAKHPERNLHTAWFHGVDKPNEVRELIQQQLRRLKDSGLGDREERPRELNGPTEVCGPSLLSGLREVYREAAALRQALQRQAGGGRLLGEGPI
jgi:uncharacterized membrane protein YdbT with pleckstrin-like domain